MSGAALAAAARGLVGVPYRRDGRDPATGLDCLGVLVAALTIVGRAVPLPPRTTLRHRRDPDIATIAAACGLRSASGRADPGDILLVRCSPQQLHLLLALDAARVVHAHAGLRRVVLGHRDPAWTLAGHWRDAPIIED